MPQRWQVSQSIYRELGIPAQCITYNGSHHEIKPEMIDDIVKFFRANSGRGFVPIQPHEYPFVEFQEIKTASRLYVASEARRAVGAAVALYFHASRGPGLSCVTDAG